MSYDPKLVGRRVKYAKLQNTEAFVPGIGGLGQSLPDPSKRTLNITMVYTPAGIYVDINSGKAEVIVPWGNVQIAVLYPEDKPTSSTVVA